MTREMKDSGIEWIGQIPKEWDIFKVKDGFSQKKSKANIENPTILSLARDGVKIRDISNNEGQLAADYSQYNPVEPGDMLLNPMDLYSGANCSLSKVSGVISPAYVNLKAKKDYSAEFYDYYFKYQYWSMAFFSHGKGVSFDNRWTLNNETLMRFPLITPCYEEQMKIASYLDSKCSQIDSLLSQIQDQIDTLKEYKKSVITKAVTKGLNPDVEMKDSGIEWIGKIPDLWDVKKLKYVMNSYDYLRKPVDAAKRSQNGNILYDYYGASGIIDQIDDYICEGRKILIGEDGANLVMRNLPLIYIADGKYWVNNHAHILEPKYDWCLDYFAYQMEIIDYTTYITGSAQPKLNQENLNNVYLVVPTKNDQQQIADYLNTKCSQINSIISQKKEQMETLKEYKKSLIYEYVTGKKEVPNEHNIK